MAHSARAPTEVGALAANGVATRAQNVKQANCTPATPSCQVQEGVLLMPKEAPKKMPRENSDYWYVLSFVVFTAEIETEMLMDGGCTPEELEEASGWTQMAQDDLKEMVLKRFWLSGTEPEMENEVRFALSFLADTRKEYNDSLLQGGVA